MDKETIIGLRSYLELPSHISDKKIEQNLKGSFSETRVNLEIAKKNFKNSLAESIPSVLKKIFFKIF